MSDFIVNCPHCKQSLEVPQEMINDEIDCPSCSNHFQFRRPQPKLKAAPKRFINLKPKPLPELKDFEIQLAPVPSKTKFCPFCGEEILTVAIKCKHCHSGLKSD